MGCVAHVGCGQMEALEAKLADMHDLIKTAALGSPPSQPRTLLALSARQARSCRAAVSSAVIALTSREALAQCVASDVRMTPRRRSNQDHPVVSPAPGRTSACRRWASTLVPPFVAQVLGWAEPARERDDGRRDAPTRAKSRCVPAPRRSRGLAPSTAAGLVLARRALTASRRVIRKFFSTPYLRCQCQCIAEQRALPIRV